MVSTAGSNRRLSIPPIPPALAVDKMPTRRLQSAQSSGLKRKRAYDTVSSSSSESGDDRVSHHKRRSSISVSTSRQRIGDAFNSDGSSDDGANEDEDDDALDAKPEHTDGLARRIHRAYVQNAILEMEKGNTTPLDELENQLSAPLFNPEGLPASQVYHVLSALTSHIDHLSSASCTSLVRTIINLPGLDSDPRTLSIPQQRAFAALVRLHARFLGVLVSSMPKWYAEIASRVVSSFTTASEWSAERWHSLLRYLVELVPTSSSVLQSIIVRMFPYKYDELPAFVRYVANILQVAQYVPELRGAIWGVIIERTVELDVDIENKLDELEDEDDDEEDESEEINIWEKSSLVSAEPQLDDDEQVFSTELAANSDPSNVKVMSSKLDLIVSFLLSQLKPSFTSVIPSNDSLVLYSTLLSHFTKYLLPTHRTHAIQYLFFSISQSAPEFTDAYLALLLETALAPSEPIPRRQMAMQYLASYVARARAVSSVQLQSVVSILSAWISRYIDEREQEVPSGDSTPLRNGARATVDLARFTMFYSVVQGFFYIFCFRYAALRGGDGEVERIPQLLQRVVNTRFNPLKWCNADVVSMFAKVAQHEGAAYCFSIIHKNKRGSAIASATEEPRASAALAVEYDGIFKRGEMKPLEGYFPFDPLLLKRTKRCVSANYVTWNEVAGGESFSSDDESASESESENESESDDDEDEDEDA